MSSMESIELRKEYGALFERWQEEQGPDTVSDVVPLFVSTETAHPGSFLPWFHFSLVGESEQSYLLFDYIFLFNAVVPQCMDLASSLLLDCTELMMARAHNDGFSSEAHRGLVEYCQQSSDALTGVLQVLSSNLGRWDSCASVIIQSCYTHDNDLIPQFIQDALLIDSKAVQYTLAMSITLLDISGSSELNREYFHQFLETYQQRFPSLPLGKMKAALFCVLKYLSVQLDDSSSDLLLSSFCSDLFRMAELPMEFSFSVFRFLHHELRTKGILTQHQWDIVSHLMKVTAAIEGKSFYPMDFLMKHLYQHDSHQALSTLFALIKRNPGICVKEFHALLGMMEKDGKVLDFAIGLLLDGSWASISTNTETIQQALDTSFLAISNALASFADLDHAFLARKGIAALWLHPRVLCPFLLALVIQSPDEQTQSMIKAYLERWVIIPYPKAFRAYKEKLMQDTSASDKQIQHISTLYEYSLEFEAAMEEVSRLKEIQPSLQQRYHKSVYEAEQQEAITKRSKELSVIRHIATEIPVLFANSTLYLHEIDSGLEESSEVSDMHTFEYSRETARTMVWDYPTFEIELSLFASEERV